MNFELIELIVAGPLHGDVQQQPVLLPAATARFHEAGRDGPAAARSGEPLDGQDGPQGDILYWMTIRLVIFFWKGQVRVWQTINLLEEPTRYLQERNDANAPK